jgi:hypothetical protein
MHLPFVSSIISYTSSFAGERKISLSPNKCIFNSVGTSNQRIEHFLGILDSVDRILKNEKKERLTSLMLQ